MYIIMTVNHFLYQGMLSEIPRTLAAFLLRTPVLMPVSFYLELPFLLPLFLPFQPLLYVTSCTSSNSASFFGVGNIPHKIICRRLQLDFNLIYVITSFDVQ